MNKSVKINEKEVPKKVTIKRNIFKDQVKQNLKLEDKHFMDNIEYQIDKQVKYLSPSSGGSELKYRMRVL